MLIDGVPSSCGFDIARSVSPYERYCKHLLTCSVLSKERYRKHLFSCSVLSNARYRKRNLFCSVSSSERYRITFSLALSHPVKDTVNTDGLAPPVQNEKRRLKRTSCLALYFQILLNKDRWSVSPNTVQMDWCSLSQVILTGTVDLSLQIPLKWTGVLFLK